MRNTEQFVILSCRLGGRPGDYDYRLGYRAEEVAHTILLYVEHASFVIAC